MDTRQKAPRFTNAGSGNLNTLTEAYQVSQLNNTITRRPLNPTAQQRTSPNIGWPVNSTAQHYTNLTAQHYTNLTAQHYINLIAQHYINSTAQHYTNPTTRQPTNLIAEQPTNLIALEEHSFEFRLERFKQIII